jgi:homoserine O-acetyltransferase (EC 2.3.1.31)
MSEYIDDLDTGPSVGLVEKQYHTFGSVDEPMTLESGRSLGPVTLAYETCGTLNAARDNAILVCHALTGDSHVAGRYQEDDPKPGWWDIMVGPGKPLDTDRYFIICTNVIGGCMGSTGPASPDPATATSDPAAAPPDPATALTGARPYGMRFPVVTIGDMVRCQRRLVDHLGIDRLLAVIGGSVGGMQVLEWSVRYPERVVAALPLATTTKHSAQAIAFNEVARQAIMADPAWMGGDYYATGRPEHGLAVARMVGHITYLSDESMRHKFDRRLQDRGELSFDFEADFQVESYLRYQGNKFVSRFDANSFLYLTKAADYFNLENQHGGGSLVAAFARARCRYLVISFTSDWLYPTYQSKAMVKAMKKNGLDVSFCEIEAPWGHDAFLLPNQRLEALIRGFLDRVGGRCATGGGNAL